MPVMNFDLEDGLPPVSFVLKEKDCQRFVQFMAECDRAIKTLAAAPTPDAQTQSRSDRSPFGSPELLQQACGLCLAIECLPPGEHQSKMSALAGDLAFGMRNLQMNGDHFWPRPVATPPVQKPITMILYCPACGKQHIDAPEGDWTNPPHRSHLCHGCGHIWRPADVATVGVEAIQTCGKNDSAPPAQEGEPDYPEAWLIKYQEGESDFVTVKLCRHNAIGDYREIYPDATCIPLYPRPSDDKLRKQAEAMLNVLDGPNPTGSELLNAREALRAELNKREANE